jgi:hypothetical protein
MVRPWPGSHSAELRDRLRRAAAASLPPHRAAPCGVALNIRAIRAMLLAVIVSLQCHPRAGVLHTVFV